MLRRYQDLRAHFTGTSHMHWTGCISVGRMDICQACAKISQIISALCIFEGKAIGGMSTTCVDRTLIQAV